MAEFEAERRMPADAEQVFAIVGDLERLAEWMPRADRGPARPATARCTPTSSRATCTPTAWSACGRSSCAWSGAAKDSPDYAGWLQVAHAEPGHSSVTMHLSFLGDQPETRRHGNAADEVRAWLDDALSRLESVVAGTS